MKQKQSKNKRYIKGADFERRVLHFFEDRGFIIARSAGSKGKFDLIGHDGLCVWNIQCKKGASKMAAYTLMEKLKAEILEKFSVITIPIVVAVVYDFVNNSPQASASVIAPNVSKAVKYPEDAIQDLKTIENTPVADSVKIGL